MSYRVCILQDMHTRNHDLFQITTMKYQRMIRNTSEISIIMNEIFNYALDRKLKRRHI